MHHAVFVSHDRYYKIVGSSENYSAILSRLREEGLNFERDNGSELLPITTIEVCFSAYDISFVFSFAFILCPSSISQCIVF